MRGVPEPFGGLGAWLTITHLPRPLLKAPNRPGKWVMVCLAPYPPKDCASQTSSP